MRSTCISPCLQMMISNFTIFLIFQIFIFKFFFTSIFAFAYDCCCSFVNSFVFFFLKLIIFIACSLKNSQNIFMESLPLHISCLFSMLFNEDIVDSEKPDGICWLTFVVVGFSGSLFFSDLHK